MDWFKTIFACVLCLLAISLQSSESPIGLQRAPVVIIPGNGGNRLEGRVTSNHGNDPCLQETDWHRFWLDIWSFAPGNFKCASRRRSLVYDKETGKSGNQPGVETRIPGWGGSDSVDYLDPSWSAFVMGNVGSYMAPLTKELKSWGYIVGKDLVAAPYDWRYLPQSQNLFPRLRTLIESTYIRNRNKKVALIAHSLGCPYTLMFLQSQPDAWKQKYIHSLISMGGPWSGATLTFVAMASGYNMRIPTVNGIDARNEQRSSESNFFLLPNNFYFSPNKPIIRTPVKNYTIQNYDTFFDDIKYPEGKRRLAAMESIRYNRSHPGVPVHCLYSHGVQTEDMFTYSEGAFPDEQPEISWSDGDGVVTLDSLKACEKWGTSQTVVKSFSGLHHNDMFGDKNVQLYIKSNLII